MTAFSVITPLYNVENYIRDAVCSVLAQTFQDFEIIIVDDFSADNSLAIAIELSRCDARINVIRHSSNKGVSAARNTGIKHAKGRYCAFLDADDMWEPNKLESHLNYLSANPGVGFTYDCSSFIDEEGEYLGLDQIPAKFKNITAKYMFLRCPVGNGSSAVILTEAIEKIKFNESLQHCEDLECWVRFLLQTNFRIEGVRKKLTRYRIRRKSASSQVSTHADEFTKVLEAIEKYAPDLISEYGSLATAYQLRYAARRSIRDAKPAIALKFLLTALCKNYKIIWHEPLRTFSTLIVCVCILPVPKKFYNLIFSLLKVRYLQRGRSSFISN
jgi:glycosyltransferase involved in cell wall biosynthesis